MAIYHLNVGKGSKATGAKAAGSGAVRGAGAKASGQGSGASAKYDYLNRAGKYNTSRGGREEVLLSESGNMPNWASEFPRKYWVSGDEFERKNGVVFREVEFALPIELGESQREELARSFAKELATTKDGQLPYSFAIHKGKGINPHVHVMLSERVNDGYDRTAETWFKRAAASPKGRKLDPTSGGAKKTTELRGDWLERTRELWAIRANEALERSHVDARIDHRSHVARGLSVRPSEHVGVKPLSIEHKTGQTSLRSRQLVSREKLDRLENQIAFRLPEFYPLVVLTIQPLPTIPAIPIFGGADQALSLVLERLLQEQQLITKMLNSCVADFKLPHIDKLIDLQLVKDISLSVIPKYGVAAKTMKNISEEIENVDRSRASKNREFVDESRRYQSSTPPVFQDSRAAFSSKSAPIGANTGSEPIECRSHQLEGKCRSGNQELIGQPAVSGEGVVDHCESNRDQTQTNVEALVSEFLAMRQAQADASADADRYVKRQEWRTIRTGETIVGPVKEIQTIHDEQYLVIGAGPNMDRSAQQYVLVKDPSPLSIGQKFYATEKDGKFLYKPDMLKSLQGKGLSR